jgi:hypothetical protein
VPGPEPDVTGLAVRGMRERLRGALDPGRRFALGSQGLS